MSCKSNEETNKDVATNNRVEISEDILKEDMEFVKKIKNIPSADRVSRAFANNLDEMISECRTNLIIRCQVIDREESKVTSCGLQFFVNDDLISENEKYYREAVGRIATPYKLQINEVYHGNINKENDIITLYALYGIVDGFENTFTNRIDPHYPIFNVGAEYILFLRVEEQYGKIVYFLSLGCLKLDTKNGTFECEDFTESMNSRYDNNTDKFVSELKELIKTNNYRTEVRVTGSKEELQDIIDQRNRERAADGLNIFLPDVIDKAQDDNAKQAEETTEAIVEPSDEPTDEVSTEIVPDVDPDNER